jgi:stage III sporulation protein AC
MDVDLIMKVAGVGMIVAVVCQILNKAGRDEQATLVSITGIVIILVIIVDEIGTLLASLKRIFGL